MKRVTKIIISSIAAALSLSCLPIAVGTVLLSNSSVYQDTFLGGLSLKRELLKSKQGKRIVLIGGSALPFGVQSGLVEQELPSYGVVDFGLYAAIGSEAMLDLAIPYLREGDIAIISPEQNEQTLSSYFSPRDMWRAIDGCKDAFFDLDESDRSDMMGDALDFSREKLPYLLHNEKAEGDGVYAKSSFDDYGDIKKELTPYNVMLEGYDPNQMISFATEVVKDSFINDMNYFAEQAAKKGAKTYYWFAPGNHSAITNNREIDSFYSYLNERITFPILGNPHDAIMNSGYFYDTNFHLNVAGSQNNTIRLINDLKVVFKDDSKTNIEAMSPPKADQEGKRNGNNADLGYFVVEEKESYCHITSLTEEGKQMESLTIPYVYNDKVIASFGADVFAENQHLQTLIIQDNIRRIENASFRGSSIARIEIHNDTPSSISVSYRLLEGCAANVYVPWYSLSKYRSNYYWSAHAERTFGFR